MKTAAKTLADVKPMLPGHWGTAPGQNFIYAHVNRVIPARLGKGVDTSTNFPLTAGRVMSTRSGDSEPGLPRFLARTAQSE